MMDVINSTETRMPALTNWLPAGINCVLDHYSFDSLSMDHGCIVLLFTVATVLASLHPR